MQEPTTSHADNILPGLLKERGDLLLRPLSNTKLNGGQCPRAVNMFYSLGAGYDFKNVPRPNRGTENLEEGIAFHALCDSWHNHHLLADEYIEPGVILAENQIRASEWPRILKEYDKFKSNFSYNGDIPLFSGGDICGIEKQLHIQDNGQPVSLMENAVASLLNMTMRTPSMARQLFPKVDSDGKEIQPDPLAPYQVKSFFKGTLDLLQYDPGNGVVTITDYKRQWNILSPADAANSPQAQQYAYIAGQHFPDAVRVVFRFYFSRSGVFRETTYLRSELEFQLKVLIQREIAMMTRIRKHSDTAAPIPGDCCSLCPFATACPALDGDILQNGVVRSQEEARALASSMHLMKRRAADSMVILKDWSKDNGPVDIGGGKAYGYVSSKSDSWELKSDAGAFISSLQNLMNDPEFSKICYPGDLISVPSKGITKLVKKINKLCEESGDWTIFEEIMMHVRPSSSTSFRNHKVE